MVKIQWAHQQEPPPANSPPNKHYVPQALRLRVLPCLCTTQDPQVVALGPPPTTAYSTTSLATLSIDFVNDLPLSNGFTAILVIIDRFSKFFRLVPSKGLLTAMETAQALFCHVFQVYGIPDNIVTDRGTQFTSQVWRAF